MTEGRRQRTDVDALRALATVAVLVYHAWPSRFAGGQMGVDVFFVVSGFVVALTTDAARFRPLAFVARRLLRVAPPQLAVCAAVAVGAWQLFLPAALVQFGKSLAATALFGTNVHQYLVVNYFAQATKLMPLQHFWTLAVEMQFYVAWTVALLLVGRLRLSNNTFAAVLVAVGAVSFAVMLRGMTVDFRASFYLLHCRLWEFAVGCVVGLLLPKTREAAAAKTVFNHCLSATGLLTIVLVMFYRSPKWQVDVTLVVLVVIGTAAVIFSGCHQETIVSRIGSFRLVQCISECSYSIYVWHWPVFSFYYTIIGTVEHDTAGGPLILLLIPLAYVSMRLLEAPFRQIKPTSTRAIATVLLAWLGGVALLAGAGAAIVRGGGFPSRLPERVSQMNKYALESPRPHLPCCLHKGWRQSVLTDAECRLGVERADATQPSVIVIGDSHAHHLEGAMFALADSLGFSGQTIATIACPALLVGRVRTLRMPDEMHLACVDYRRHMREYLLAPERRRSLIVIGGVWTLYVTGGRSMHEPEGKSALGGYLWRDDDDGDAAEATEWTSRAVFEETLRATVRELTDFGHHVALLGLLPLLDFNPMLTTASAWLRGAEPRSMPRRPHLDAFQGPVNEILRRVAAENERAHYVDQRGHLCGADSCRVTIGDVMVFRDRSHLSYKGAQEYAKLIEPQFAALLKLLA